MDTEPSPQTPLSRRALIGGIVAGAATVTAGVSVAAAQDRDRDRRNGDSRRGGERDDDRDGGRRDSGDRDRDRRDGQTGDTGENRSFSRIFDAEPAFDEVSDDLRTQIAELGAPGGLLDPLDALEEGAVRLITEPELSINNPNNPAHTAGTTFIGQFLDHDITRDAGSTLGQKASLRRSVNLRSARFDLDSVYGGGPSESPGLYEPSDLALFRVESGGLFEDLPRTSDEQAIVGDPRNDENLIIAGLQVAFLKFHNAIVERMRASGATDSDVVFADARLLAQRHYQWLILHQFLPQYVGQAMVDDVTTGGRRFYTDDQPSIPVEFQTSAYRFGHSMIRPSYRANLAGDNGEPFFGMVFDPSQFGVADPDDMSGGHRAPRRFIGWQTFFDFGDGEVKPNKRIDTHISTPLFQLPMGTISTARGEPIGPLSLATRNLLRHITWGIPSGERVAQMMSAAQLAPQDLADISDVAPLLAGRTPLWLYILREADIMADGEHLGPVGGRIVAEVFIGLLQMDPSSILNTPDWRPTLGSIDGDGGFRMADLLTVAGVDPTTRGQ